MPQANYMQQDDARRADALRDAMLAYVQTAMRSLRDNRSGVAVVRWSGVVLDDADRANRRVASAST